MGIFMIMKCRTCKKKLTKENLIKHGFCSTNCKKDRKSGIWSDISGLFFFFGELLSGLSSLF